VLLEISTTHDPATDLGFLRRRSNLWSCLAGRDRRPGAARGWRALGAPTIV